jgi:rare lipoprotein A (peptidoglycan hydrolase)
MTNSDREPLLMDLMDRLRFESSLSLDVLNLKSLAPSTHGRPLSFSGTWIVNVRIMMRATWASISLMLCLGLSCCTRSEKEATADTPVPPDPEALRKAEQVAEKVKEKAHRSEKAEGKQNLVKDKVEVKTTPQGEPVIEQTGEASRYANSLQGKTTADGEKFDRRKLTAAHPALPLGTKAKVTNLENGKSVDVTINDRGPYVKGRDIDLSPKAAKELEITKQGVAPVKIEAEIPPPENSIPPDDSRDSEKNPEKKSSTK